MIGTEDNAYLRTAFQNLHFQAFPGRMEVNDTVAIAKIKRKDVGALMLIHHPDITDLTPVDDIIDLALLSDQFSSHICKVR
jgi:hypothetical protein